MDTIDGMRTFFAVAAEGSFSGAAQRLGMSPQLVSKYVGQLEERLGVRLLNRTTRTLHLTENGQAYYERGTRLLDDFDTLESAVRNRVGEPRGKLKVSAPVTFGESNLARVVGEFAKANPRVDVELRLTDRVVNVVAEGFDIAVRIGALQDSSLISRRLGNVQLLPCASPAYLEGKALPSDPAELPSYECVIDLNQATPYQWSYADSDGERLTVSVKGRIAVDSARAARNLAVGGVGIALCPDFAVMDDVLAGRLAVLFDRYQFTERGIYAVYPHSRHLEGKVRAFVDFIAEQVQAMCSGARPGQR